MQSVIDVMAGVLVVLSVCGYGLIVLKFFLMLGDDYQSQSEGKNDMDALLDFIRSALPAVGSAVLYSKIADDAAKTGHNVALLPNAIYQLRDAGFLKKEVGRREGDTKAQYRLVRIGA